MFNTNFNTNFQNNPNQVQGNLANALNYGQNITPYGLDTNLDGQYFPDQEANMPYPVEPMMDPQPLQGNNMETNLYPFQSLSPQNAATDNFNGQQGYAKGGRVELNNFPRLAKMLQDQGRGGDTILAHINPEEAALLKALGGSGSINPNTGLPEFLPGFVKNPWKAIKGAVTNVLSYGLGGHLASQLLPRKERKAVKSFGRKYVLPAGAAMLGNTILPGVGGIIGGTVGGIGGTALSGRNDYGQSAMRGAIIGALLPTAASGLGWGASQLGATGLGSALSNYGSANAILPSLGIGGGGNGITSPIWANSLGGGNSGQTPQISGVSAGDAMEGNNAREMGFLEALGHNTKSYLTQPGNLLTLASTAASFAGRPKEKTPEQIAAEEKRFEKARRYTPEERAELEASLIADEQSRLRIRRNRFLPDEGKFGTAYRKTHTPDEYNRTGSWFSYYDNPNYQGAPIPFKEGGRVPEALFEEVETIPSRGVGYFLEGNSGGQEDNRRMDLPEGAYTIEASTLSDIGDGNSKAGANIVKALVSDGEMVLSPEEVAQFAKYGAKNLDRMVKNVRKHKRGGRTTLPPKAKSLTEYLRG